MKFRRKTTDKDGAKPHSKAFRFLRGVIVLLLIAALALAAFWFAVPRYIERRIQGALGEGLTSQLGVDTSVAHVDVDLPGRTVTVYGFRLQQPGGFGSGSMLYLPELRVKVDTAGLISGDYRIEEVDMHRGEINLKTLTNAISNVDALIASVKRQKKESLEEPAEPWSLHIDSLGVYDWAINYHELTEKLRLIEFGVGSVNGELANFRSGALPVAGLREPAHLSLQGQIMNCPYSRGRCGIVGVFSPLTNAPPAFNMWAQFVGFELALIEPALPDNTAALLGGDALDGSLRIQSDSSFVEGKATVKMVAGHEYSVRIMGEAA
ncbi:MAG: AsmA family protein, partial [Verrucomicrobiota bacterium]